MRILLTTLNARYTHSAVGLRCLYANMHELRDETRIMEFTINEAIQATAEKLLAEAPAIIGIGVYIWNASQVRELVEIIKKVAPKTVIVLGGPEAGYLPHRVDFDRADYIIQGEGEAAFYELCRKILDGSPPMERFLRAPLPDLKKIELPYDYYTDHDIQNRYIYVEASRGCPFECEFCLSSIDEKVRSFGTDRLMEAFERLWERGVRSFKFIDRTFNLNIRFANRLMDFFLAKEPPYFIHFEVIPDHFPESLRERISRFPPASLQLEIGIQTLNPVIAQNINRPLDIPKIKENIAFLENHTKAHMHLDLIVGLPGEDLESFGKNLDALCSLTGSEIQIGILKKLSGTTLSRHDELHGMVYSDTPPYDVLKTADVSFEELQQMKRFARFWDLLYNSGNFPKSVRLIWGDGSVYAGFRAFSEWMYATTQATWKISLERLTGLLFEYLTGTKGLAAPEAAAALLEDLNRVAGRTIPAYLRPYTDQAGTVSQPLQGAGGNRRQHKHA